jgi:mercuric ion transport protein
MKRELWPAAGAIGASLLLASCCLGPTLFLLFGVSAAALGQLSGLEPYRPLFMAVGAFALVCAFWVAWKPQGARERAGDSCRSGACEPARVRRSLRQLALLALALYGFALAYPWLLATVL